MNFMTVKSVIRENLKVLFRFEHLDRLGCQNVNLYYCENT